MHGVYALQGISRRNFDSAWGAKPLRCHYNPRGIFLVYIAHTCPYIDDFITWGNRKIHVWTLTETLTDCSLEPVQDLVHYIQDGKAMRWTLMDRTSQPPCLQLALQLSTTLSPTCHHFLCMYEHVTSVTSHVTSVTAPVMSITLLLWACGAWLLQITHVRCLSSYGFPSNKYT